MPNKKVLHLAVAMLALSASADAATLLPNGMQCFQATTPQSGGLYGPIATLGSITGGGGYNDGTYANVPLTGGGGIGATATITVMGGQVTGVSLSNPGTHFTTADVLGADARSLGGTGSGFAVPVATVTGTGTGMVGLLGPIDRGRGGRDGVYGGVSLQGGAGMGATANVQVRGGRAVDVTILDPGKSYQVGDVLTATPGGVVGLRVPIASVTINQSLAGGLVYMFVPGTQTAKQTWRDSAQTSLNTNPVTLDANGCAVIYGTGIYRQVLTDAMGNIVWDHPTTDTSVQNVSWAGVATAAGTPNAVILNDPGFNGIDGSIVNFIPIAINTGQVTVSFESTSYQNIPLVLDMFSGPQPLTGNELVPNNVVSMIYSAESGSFHLINSAQAANLELINQQVQQLVAAAALAPTVQEFTAGNGTYVPNQNHQVVLARVRMIGGGGGGGGQTGVGGPGGTTAFGLWTALGGSPGAGPQNTVGGGGGNGGSGGASDPVVGLQVGRWPGGGGSAGASLGTGTQAGEILVGGAGGNGIFGGGGGGMGQVAGGGVGANTGGGGGGSANAIDIAGSGGGGAGEGVEFVIQNPSAQGFAWVVGAGGTAGPGGMVGADTGSAGRITVEETYH